MNSALGFLELNNVSDGIACMDFMLKGALINVIRSSVVNPGKFFIIIEGSYGNIENAMQIAVNNFEQSIVDFYMIGKAEEALLSSLKGIESAENLESLAIIDTLNIITGVIIADITSKTSNARVVRFNISETMGGRTSIVISGEYSSVKHAVEQISSPINLRDKIIACNVIANPHDTLKEALFHNK
ncbi:BMC domain-containing protein [Desnuesiella massiliensis]|uniref:BMC domain-containing protein n=1 Tax=Desnuesiella massiliensis TaxID=1650662 RepID=UPI0006E1F365|nr:BMC domain-containing protein [Desnuesiella massiliensis]